MCACSSFTHQKPFCGQGKQSCQHAIKYLDGIETSAPRSHEERVQLVLYELVLVVVSDGSMLTLRREAGEVKSGPVLRVGHRQKALQRSEQFRIIDFEVAEVWLDAEQVPERLRENRKSKKVNVEKALRT